MKIPNEIHNMWFNTKSDTIKIDKHIQWNCSRAGMAYNKNFIMAVKTIGAVIFLMLHMWKIIQNEGFSPAP
jgi:hypothetical protein